MIHQLTPELLAVQDEEYGEWRDIKNYENLYKVSYLGFVFSIMSNKMLKPIINSSGYHSVCLYKNKKGCPYRVHRIVAETFIKNPKNKPQVNHINGIKTDNRRVNLEWATPKENVRHAIETKLTVNHGDNNNFVKMSEKTAIEIYNKVAQGQTQTALSVEYGISISAISLLISGKNWKYLKLKPLRKYNTQNNYTDTPMIKMNRIRRSKNKPFIL